VTRALTFSRAFSLAARASSFEFPFFGNLLCTLGINLIGSSRQDERHSALRGLDPTPQHFGDAPRLCDATARSVRFVGVKNFADCARPASPKCSGSSRRNFRAFTLSFDEPLARRHERSDQPCPTVPGDSAIARAEVARIDCLVFGIIGRKRAQPHRGDQSVLQLHREPIPTLLIEYWVIERNCEELVRPAGNIVCPVLPVTVDYVIQYPPSHTRSVR